MEQTGQNIFLFLQYYGYWIMLPLMVAEGPVVTLISAMLASLGAFNIGVVFLFSLLGDMIGDVIIYSLGYKFGMGFVYNIGKYFGITEKLVVRMEKYFNRYGSKTIFAVKSTTGLCWAAFIAAGIVKMDFKKFLKNSFYGGIFWSGFLVILGYFYGYLWREINNYIKWAGWVAIFLAVITILVVAFYKKRKAKIILKEENISN